MRSLVLVSLLALASVVSSATFAADHHHNSGIVPPHLRAGATTGDVEKYPTDYYNYIPINDGYDSNFFYKLETIVPTKAERAKLPLIMWLQGGPGSSSMFGAYCETGAKLMKVDTSTVDPKNGGKAYFEANPFTWAKYGTVLYVDNPIGAGFSYTKDPKGFSTTDEGIAANLVTFMRGFLARHPEYAANEFHVFSESYGGKMAAFFGNALAKAVITEKSFPAGFRIGSIALGDGWLDPVACMESYGDYLFNLGQLSELQKATSDDYAVEAKAAVARGAGTAATALWRTQQRYLTGASNNVNWYNALLTFSYLPEDEIDEWLLRDFPKLPEVTRTVNITSPYGAQGNEVFSRMGGAFMQSGIAEVESMLNMGVKVSVYVGEVDLIVNPLCTRRWVDKMTNWDGLAAFRQKRLVGVVSPDHFPYPRQVLANKQAHENLQFWTVRTAGHMVPTDAPLASELMLAAILGVEPRINASWSAAEAREQLKRAEEARLAGAKPIASDRQWKL